MSDQSLTHKDLATLLGVSETTIKSYRRKFADCIPVASRGKPIRFTAEAGTVCLRIRDLFADGLSVPEARARLAEEFSWISIVAREKKDSDVAQVALPHEFTMGISNLAKSMVTLTQQQGGILKRLQELEENMTALAVPPSAAAFADGGETPFRQPPPGADLSELLAPLARLEVLDSLGGVESLTTALHQATSALTGAAEALNDAAAKLALTEMSFTEQVQRLAGLGSSPDSAADVPAPSRIVRFPGPSAQAGQAGQAPQIGQSSQAGQAPQQEAAEQAPRELLALPLIIKTFDGSFIPAGGRARGPFCINDFKAILAHSKLPPEHYVMRWQRTAGGWWLVLEQPQSASPRPLRLLLRELSTPRGMNVAELLQFLDRGENVPPSQFTVFVNSLTTVPEESR